MKQWTDNGPTDGNKIRVVIGRFQPFCRGHEYLIDQACKDAVTLVIFLGSVNHAQTFKNPFTDFERQIIFS